MLSKYERENIGNAKALIEQSMPLYPGNKKLSKTALCNEHKLTKSFVFLFGQTPYQYYLKLRLERAKELLSEGRLTVDAVAYELEYRWTPAFARAFKKAFGCTPGKFSKDNSLLQQGTDL